MTQHPETPPPAASTRAWRDLMQTLAGLDEAFLTGDRAVADDRNLADGYRQLATLLGLAFDTYLFCDPSRPQFVTINTPFNRNRRWGGDNTDAYYSICAVDPERRYRVSGSGGNPAYFSLTAYNEPTPGSWSDQIVAHVNDDDLDIAADGSFSLEWGPLPGAAILMTRDYLADPITDRPVTWQIECLDDAPPVRHGDAETAERIRAVGSWLQTMFAIIPLAVGRTHEDERLSLGHEVADRANTLGTPYQIKDVNFGWSARDACYSIGSFDLAEDEALVITHRPPDCRFWNLVVWNQMMATHPITDARSSVNGFSAAPNADGSVTVVVARAQLAHPNAVTTSDYPRGNLAFRWFVAEETPEVPQVEVVKVSAVPVTTS